MPNGGFGHTPKRLYPFSDGASPSGRRSPRLIARTSLHVTAMRAAELQEAAAAEAEAEAEDAEDEEAAAEEAEAGDMNDE